MNKDALNYYSEILAFTLRLIYGYLLVSVLSMEADYWLYVAFTGITAFLAYGDLGFVSIAIKFFNSSFEYRSLKHFSATMYLGLLIAVLVSTFAIAVYVNPAIYYGDSDSFVDNELATLTMCVVVQSFSLVFKRILEGILRADLYLAFYNLVNSGFFLVMIVYLLLVSCEYINMGVVLAISFQSLLYLLVVGILVFRVWWIFRGDLVHVFSIDRMLFRRVIRMNSYAIIVTISWFIYSELDRSLLTRVGDKVALEQLGVILFFLGVSRPVIGIFTRQVPIKLNILVQSGGEGRTAFISSVVRSNFFWLTLFVSFLLEWSHPILGFVSDIIVDKNILLLAILGLIPTIYGTLYTSTIESYSLYKIGSVVAVTQSAIFVLLLMIFGINLYVLFVARAIMNTIFLLVYIWTVRSYNETTGLNLRVVMIFTLYMLKSLWVGALVSSSLQVAILISVSSAVILVLFNKKNLKLV